MVLDFLHISDCVGLLLNNPGYFIIILPLSFRVMKAHMNLFSSEEVLGVNTKYVLNRGVNIINIETANDHSRDTFVGLTHQ